ncbi:MAG: hypothetical protein KVP17_003235 [Porospora cf. gigantea B]|uniref:uncharacterized protein n=1 Tax=Porospora cf. gigantea B TaxID=2853592 RepID=UPI003571ECFC|nr:MAG: hypothetical protein KVP17_003235 [Porospora cf. gigantea B]
MDLVPSRRSFSENITFATGVVYLSSLMLGALGGGAKGAVGGDRFEGHPKRLKMLANQTFNEAETTAVSTAEKWTPRMLLAKLVEPTVDRLVLTDWNTLKADVTSKPTRKEKVVTFSRRLLTKPAKEPTHNQHLCIDFVAGTTSALLFRWNRLNREARRRTLLLSTAGGLCNMTMKHIERI